MPIIPIPGSNQAAGVMQDRIDTRQERTAPALRGFDCELFDGGRGPLTDRIDLRGELVAEVCAADSLTPIVIFEYSARDLATSTTQT